MLTPKLGMNATTTPLPRRNRFLAALLSLLGLTIAVPGGDAADSGVSVALELAPAEGNPRNSEGDFVRLKDGGLLFVYTHFTGGGGDNASAHLAGRVSKDEGRTWTREDRLILENEGGENVMSVSLERLPDGRIALLYLRKNSWDDCRPYLRFSSDEAETWSEPVEIVPDSRIGYYVVNNDRLLRLSSGRLVVPAARHNDPSLGKFDARGVMVCFYSDDLGETWRQSTDERDGTPAGGGNRVTLQEPGVVELHGGELLMFARTNGGSQYFSRSRDGGDTWSRFEPSGLISPVSPATIERIPSTGHLLCVWNDHAKIGPALKGKRTPLAAAISKDDGKTWGPSRILCDDPDGWYCYTAMEFVESAKGGDTAVLLGHCAGSRSGGNGLGLTRVTVAPLSWFYGETEPEKTGKP